MKSHSLLSRSLSHNTVGVERHLVGKGVKESTEVFARMRTTRLASAFHFKREATEYLQTSVPKIKVNTCYAVIKSDLQSLLRRAKGFLVPRGLF